jgi:hypothetical protein
MYLQANYALRANKCIVDRIPSQIQPVTSIERDLDFL